MEKVLNGEDDSFAGLDDIERDTAQTLETNIAVLTDKFGDQTDAAITILISKLLQVMGN